MDSIYHGKRHLWDGMMYVLICFSAFLAVALLLGIVIYVFSYGIKRVDWHFLTGVTSFLEGSEGIGGNIVNTLYLILLTMVFVLPLGISTAIYLNEYAKGGRLVRLIELATETLAGIPSIIFGLFGMLFFGQTLGLGYSILNGVLTMTLMVLPLVTRNTQEALKTVPLSYRMGAIGLGAGKWYTIRTILLPSALPGIVTGVILSIGRIVGESAALLYTAGSSDLLPDSFKAIFEKIGQSGGTLTIRLYLSMSDGKYDVAFGVGVVLLVIVLGMNLLTKVVAKRLDVDRVR